MIHIEPLVVMLRHIPDGVYLDPYAWKSTGVRIEPGVIELQGVDRPVTPTIWRELHEALHHEWNRVVFRRVRDGCMERHVIDISGPRPRTVRAGIVLTGECP